VQAVAPVALEGVPATDDSCLLEPLLIALVANGHGSAVDVDPLLAGYAEPQQRPTWLTVRADRAGRVFLPRLGYLANLPRESRIELVRTGSSELGYAPRDGGQVGEVPLSKLQLGCSRVSVLAHPIPLLDSPAVVSDGSGPLRAVQESARRGRRRLTAAIEVLERDWPELMGLIDATVRHIVLFRDSRRNSFATPAAHGVAFLNTPLPSVPFFVEDLAHQCGHVIFSAAWQGGEPLLGEPDATMAKVGGHAQDRRSLEVALHGMVTQVLMIAALERYSAGCGVSEQASEALARLRFALLRLSHDVRCFAAANAFTDEGEALFTVLVSACERARDLHGEQAASEDHSTQGYDFDYEVYRASNPEPYIADTLAGS
jgi:HEXXH motif-containing protein